jgi:hypothetical protein
MTVGGGDSGAPIFYPLVSPDPLYAMGILIAGGPLYHDDHTDPNPSWWYSYCAAPDTCTVLYTPWENLEGYFRRIFLPY